MRRRQVTRIEWDPDDQVFRTRYAEPRPELTNEERPAVARESVSSLLAKSFGRRLSSGATVPAHLRKYVKHSA